MKIRYEEEINKSGEAALEEIRTALPSLSNLYQLLFTLELNGKKYIP